MTRQQSQRQGPDLLVYERPLWAKNIRFIAGVDEAGRGPLAGPVVAAAVIFYPGENLPGVRDSKKLTAVKREELFPVICEKAAAVATADVDEEEIDRIHILQATYSAMKQALSRLPVRPEHVLVDGHPIPNLHIHQTAIIGGDDKSLSIAAASIVAKVTRDRLMMMFDGLYPQYGFAQHKGYGTQIHLRAIREYGCCPIHRKSFSLNGWIS